MDEAEAEILVELESSDLCIGDAVGISLEPEMQSLKKYQQMRIKYSEKEESVYLIILKCFSNTKVIFVHISEEGRPKRKL